MSPGTARLPDRAPAPEEIVGLLANSLRLSLVAILAGREHTIEELVSAAGADARSVLDQLGRLQGPGVVAEHDGLYRLVRDVFARSIRDCASQRVGPLNDKHTQLARRYFFRNRLVQMPSEQWAVEVILELVSQDFQPGEVYDEREVNTTLYAWYEDWALLRRLLVDRGYLQRSAGRYWRTSRQPQVVDDG